MLVIWTFLNSAGNTEAGPINVSQPFTTDDNSIIEELKQLGTESSNPDQEENGIQAQASAAEESDTKVTRTASRRTVQNTCIARYENRIIHNYFFRIPVCKKGCKRKVRFVNFGKGKTYAIVYDCYK